MMGRRGTKEEVLVDYMEGRLSERERLKVEQHLSGCDSCVEELVIAGKLGDVASSLGLETVPEQVTERAVHMVREFSRESLFDRISAYVKPVISKGRNAFMGPWPRMNRSLAPVRGSKTVLAGDLILLRKSFSDFEVHIEIEKTSDGRAFILVRVPDLDESENPIRATLLKNGREMSSLLCVGQAATFEEVPFGRYTLVFSRDGVKVGEYAFIIKETPHGTEQKQ
jgi:hypothetical protein